MSQPTMTNEKDLNQTVELEVFASGLRLTGSAYSPARPDGNMFRIFPRGDFGGFMAQKVSGCLSSEPVYCPSQEKAVAWCVYQAQLEYPRPAWDWVPKYPGSK
jgi:hypothetical protein